MEIAWNRTQKELKMFVYRRVKDKALAEDIVQDVLVKVYTRVAQLKDSEKLTGWIYQITRNAITDYFRAKSKTKELTDLDWEVISRCSIIVLHHAWAICLLHSLKNTGKHWN